MRKKFTMLLMSLLAFVGVAKAQVKVISEIRENITDISELEDNSYVIFKNVGRNGYVYEQSADKLMKLGTEAIVGKGAEYIWQVHKEDGGKYSFSSATGNYISTPLDGGNVYTVASDNENKDNFIITQHHENQENWKLQSSNNTDIYWDGQGADGSHRFVGWQGKGNNSQYQIIPVSVDELYSLTVFYQRNGKTVHTETANVEPNSNFNVTAPIFTTIESCSIIGGESIEGDENGIYSCTISEHNTEIMVQISKTSLDLTKTYRLKNVLSGLFMTIVGTGQAGEIQIKNLSEDAAQKFTFEETQTKNGYKIKSGNDTENSYYLTALGAWDYSATTEGGSIHIIEEVGEEVYRLKSINGYIASNQDATAAGSPMYSNHPQDRNTNTWEFVSTEKAPYKLLQEEIAILKSEAEYILGVFSSINIETTPFTETTSILNAAINEASEIGQVTDLNTLNEIKANLNTAINLANKTIFHNGVLASLEAGEYIVYYEDNSGNKHYLKNEGDRVKSSALPTVYDVKNGNTESGYVEYAYHFNMNNTNISNPTNNDAKEIQTDSKTRVWDSQVLYVNSQGKYAIRSTNCPAGSNWNSDAFITISEDGKTVSGQNTDLSDALYIWNIENVNAEASINEASINNVKYETLTAAINAAEAGATVTMLKDINVASAVQVAKDLTINMNGKKLTSAGDGFEIKAGTLIITGNGTVNAGTTGGQWVAVWANGGNAVIENGTYSVVADKDNTTNDCIYAKGGQITINGGTFSNVGTYVAGNGGVVINAHNTIANSKVIINGGTFNPAEGCVPYEVADVEAGRIELNTAAKVGNQYYTSLDAAIAAAEAGATVTMLKDINVASAVQVAKNLTINMNGKTLTSAKDGFEITAGTLTITGNGTVAAGTTGDQWVAVWANRGNAVIENGTYSVVADKNNTTNDCIYAKNGGQITINGGTFSNVGTYVAGNGGVVINANNGDKGEEYIGYITINGGTIIPAEGCVAYEVADVEAGRIELNTAAKVGNQYYTSLDAAIAAAEANATVTMLKDINVASAVQVAQDLTINMNGKKLTSAGDGFEIKAGTLIITGNGTVNAGTTGGQWVAVWANGGNAVIENGTYSVVADKDNTTNDCIYAKGGQITVNGGTFRNVGTYVAGNGGVVINAHNTIANSKVIINGGTFNPAEDCVPYEVADVEAGRIELNNAAVNESELKIAVAAGKNVKFGADINIASAVVVTKDLTIDMNGKTLTSAGDGFEVKAGTLTITGNGTVAAGTTGGQWVAVWANGGNAVIENGTYSVVADKNDTTNDCIYAKGGQITINGGTFSNVGTYVAGNGGVVINAHNTIANSKVIINGGTFNPAEGCVPYEVADVEAGRIELNSVANETELKIAVAAGKNVTLGADIEVSSAIQVADVIELNLNGKTITRAEGYVFEVTGELTVTGGTIAESGICYIINDADYKTEAGKTYAISADKENVDIKYTRTFGHDSWQVLFVPFEIKVTEDLLNDFEVYTITGVNEVRVEVSDVTVGTKLSAHTPYLIKAKGTGEKTITATNVTLEATKDYVYSKTIDGYTFTGIYTSEAIVAHDKYVLTDGKWCRLSDKAVEDGNNVLGAFRVYLEVPAGTTANALSITRGETGIEELSTVNDQQSTVIYDLTGRKVEAMDKGIYIVNGRKIVIK